MANARAKLRAVPSLKERRDEVPPIDRCNDLANSARFAADHRGQLLYCAALGGWMVFRGERWELDVLGLVDRLARETVKKQYAEAVDAGDSFLARWSARCANRGRLEAMTSMARSEVGIAATHDVFDRDPWLLNTASGILNLKSGELRPHDPWAHLTRLAPTFYRPEAKCPRWEAFLDRVLKGNADLVSFIQRAIGYSLSGSTVEQLMFLLYGSGANGKSVLIEVLRRLFGDYASSAPAETFLVRNGGGSGIPNDLARLRGQRFVSVAETEDGRRFAEGLVKQVTGGDTISARFLHREFFEFRPAFKLWLATNHRPVIRGVDYAIWRRIRLVPFEVTIPREERDPHLVDRLVGEEGAGILAWCVRGCLAWQKDGLSEPEAVTAATADYKADMDVLGDFLSDRCVRAPGLCAPSRRLWEAFRAWSNDRPELTETAFSLRLQERGFATRRTNKGRVFDGIGLAAEPDSGGHA